MKIVFFTNKCSHGAELLTEIKQNNIKLDAIFFERRKANNAVKEAKKIIKRDGYFELLRQFKKKITAKVFPAEPMPWQDDDYYHSYSERVLAVDDFNGQACEQTLKKISPDIIVLGGSRIIREQIINIPKIGLLNAHPGLLPKYRGIDVIPWAILSGDDVGVSVHFIDAGIDTGKICATEVLSINLEDDIHSLRRKAEKLAGKLMARTLISIIENREIEPIENPKEEGRQFYKMSRKMLQKAELELRKRTRVAESKIQG